MIEEDKRSCFNGPLPTTMTDDELYNFFIENIYNGNLRIYGNPVNVFRTPVIDNRMQGYFHITTSTQKKLGIKIRMKEPRAFFTNKEFSLY